MISTRELRAYGRRIRTIAQEVSRRWLPSHPAPTVRVTRSERPDYIDVTISDDLVQRRTYSIVTYPGLDESLSNGGMHEMDARYRFSMYTRLMARELALREHPGQEAPLWAFSAARLFHDVLVDSGLDPRRLVANHGTYDHWEPQPVGGGYGERRTLCAFGRIDDRIAGTIYLHDGTRRVDISAGRGHNGACSVLVHDTALPEPALAAIAGMRLRDVVDHPALGKTGTTVISRAWNMASSKDLKMELEPDVLWLQDEAPGLDLSWQNICEGSLAPLG